MNRKVIGAAFLGFVALKAAGRHHAMGGGLGPRSGFGPQGRRGFGPRGRHGFGPGGNDPRRQWIRDFHRSLHEEDSEIGSPADPTNPENPTTAV